MSSFRRVALFLSILAFVAPFSPAADFEADTNGPWINVDVIDLADYGDATYLDYLGEGYVAMLDALKSEEMILDYGVMMKTTGSTSDGDVVVWWSVKSLADYEKALERMGTLAGELWTEGELAELWPKLEKVRTIKSSNLYRAVLWNKVAE
ncbi:MAG: hypothetical protein IFK93_12650 [Acidobacteria bacterium]|jgi:hypothetical protein|nr:hypothetical protein [Candidatus Sulfomarinibacter kjeldsenii]MBD3857127.1 hypothetical protein [Candidatus Sulfomarinibacter kjeldsenii]